MPSDVIVSDAIAEQSTLNEGTRKYLLQGQSGRVRTIGSNDYPFSELWIAVLWSWVPAINLTLLSTSSNALILASANNGVLRWVFGLSSSSNTWYNSATNHFLGLQVATVGTGLINQYKSAAGNFYVAQAVTGFKVEDSVPTYGSGSVRNIASCQTERRSIFFIRYVVGSPWSMTLLTPLTEADTEKDWTQDELQSVLEEPDWTTLNGKLATYGLQSLFPSMTVDEATYGNLDSVIVGSPFWRFPIHVDTVAGIKKS